MIRSVRCHCLLTLVALTAGLAPRALAQLSNNLPFSVSQLGQATGPPTYSLRILPVFGFAASIQLTAPDGTVFGSSFPSAPLFIDVASPTFADFGQRFFGTWTIDERPFSSSQPASKYQFTFSAFALNHVFSETPTITTPLDGASVPPSFFLEWQYPSGATSSSRTISYSPGGDPVSTVFDPTSFRVKFNVDLPQFGGPGQLRIRAGATSSLAPYLSAVTLVSGPLRTNFTIDPPRFSTYSAQVAVNVVPEPASLALTSIGAALFLRRRRRLVLWNGDRCFRG